ncbi:MAG TPA: SseB family protein [Polyangiaceae bacterium]|nr:SseB family protein [Polyangiaceae bacterium]
MAYETGTDESADASSAAGAADTQDLTPLIKNAQRGLRRDVQALLDRLPKGELCIPLVRNIAGVADGERLEIDDGEVKLVPHMLLDEEGNHYAALFSHPELMAPMEQQLGWKTDGEDLKFCTVPALFALDMALEVVDDEHVLGLVLNAVTEYELALRRADLASLTNGKALPLVGYVANLDPDETETTIIAEGGEPPAPALTAAIEGCLSQLPQVAGYALLRTFNPERDLEPHPTLKLTTKTEAAAELRAIAGKMIDAIGKHLPPPGYIDIVFDRIDD